MSVAIWERYSAPPGPLFCFAPALHATQAFGRKCGDVAWRASWQGSTVCAAASPRCSCWRHAGIGAVVLARFAQAAGAACRATWHPREGALAVDSAGGGIRHPSQSASGASCSTFREGVASPASAALGGGSFGMAVAPMPMDYWCDPEARGNMYPGRRTNIRLPGSLPARKGPPFLLNSDT